MTQDREHLTDNQIQQYVLQDFVDSTEADDTTVESHIADCDQCRLRVLESERRQLDAQEHSLEQFRSYPACPSVDTLTEYASGLCDSDTAGHVLEHVSNCDHCAPLLKVYLDDSSVSVPEPATPDFTAGLVYNRKGDLSAVPHEVDETPGLPKNDASKTIYGFRSSPFRALFKSRFAWAGALAFAVLLVAVAPSIVNQYELRNTQNLIAAAFSERPVTEMRFTWSPYSEWSPTRGTSPASKRMPYALADALSEVNHKRGSSDPRWMRASGRVYLLQGDTEQATEFLMQAAGKLDDPGTEIDLAVAYFEIVLAQSQKTSDAQGQPAPPNLSQTTELLNKVVNSSKATSNERGVALFNLAIAYEKMRWWDMAARFWTDYLKLDSTTRWADEARQRLTEDNKQMHPPRPQGYRSPTFYLRHSDDPDTLQSTEEYLDVALRDWLPAALTNRDPETWKALYRLSEILQQYHGDPWLRDFLRADLSGDQWAVLLLRDALNNNRNGLSKTAEVAAVSAQFRFTSRKNIAGVLWARFEAIYAEQRQIEETPCLEQASILADDLRHTSYKWLQTQVALEQVACHAFKEEFDVAEQYLSLARQSAAAAKFHILQLRVLAFEAGLKHSSLNCDESWPPVVTGLQQYWEGPAVPIRLYELYSHAEGCLADRDLWHAARALQERQIAILEQDLDPHDRNVLFQASVHDGMSNILQKLKEAGSAQNEKDISVKMHEQIRQDSRTDEIFVMLQQAESQLESGDSRQALSTLEAERNTFMGIDSDFVHLSFYRLLGDVELALNELGKAEAAYRNGLELAESGVSYLKDPEERRQWINYAGAVYRRMAGVLLQKQQYREALQLWEWYQARPFVAALPAGAISWERIQKEVLGQPVPSPQLETRLIFAAIGNKLHLWIINHEEIKPLWIQIKPNELARMINTFSKKCSQRDSELEQESQRLFDLLLGPAMEQISRSGVVVADLDQSMNGLLLEALQSREGWYFGQKYSIVYSPGFLKEAQLRPRAGPLLESGLLLDASTSSAEIPLDRTERQALIQTFPQLTVLNGAETTPQELRSHLGKSRMFLFIGHGSTEGLKLNRQSILKPQDISPMSLLHMQLAVLAACSTGVSKDGLLDTRGLINAFLAGGVSDVVASHWEVDSRSTTQLMTGFYTSLRQGKNVAQSMFDARQKVFQNHHHPYYWAAFSISGTLN